MSVRTEGSSNYEYVTARVRSRRASLFDADDYRKLVRMGPGEIARFMEETEYEEELNELGSRYEGVDLIEYALNQNLAKHFDDLLRWADGRLYDYVARYLRKFDAWNVKTVIRGLYSGAEREEIEEDLIRAGEFPDEQVRQLLDADSIEVVVDQLQGTIFGEELADAFEIYEETGTLVALENAVDMAFYEQLMEDLPEAPDAATQLYIEFLRAEIDFRNIRNALRLARSGAELDLTEFYIEGGRLFDATELRQLANTPDELAARLRSSVYGDQIEAALDALEEAESLIEFEHGLDEALLEFADHLSNRYPLSVCPVLAYVLDKEREVENIRAIARGREAGLSEDEIEEELVIL